MTEGRVFRQLITFAVPFMLANILQIVYNLVDMAIVGQFVGSDGLSAVSNGTDIMHLELLFCMGFANAGQVIISQCVGAKNADGIRRIVGTLFTVLTIFAVIVTAVGLIFTDPLLEVLNVPEEALAGARDYVIVCFCGTIFSYGYNLVSAILRGMGDSKHPLWFVAIAAVVNLILDLLFVAGFGMGTFGAALATIIGQAISLICSMTYLFRHRDAFGFDFRLRSFIPEKEMLKSLFKLGIPMALQNSAISISQLFVLSHINDCGLVASAVNGVGQKIAQVAMIVTNAINSASSSMIGQNVAAEKPERVKRIVYSSFAVNFAFCALLSLIMILFPEQVFGIFNREPEILAMAHTYSLIAVLNFFGFGARSPMMALTNGTGAAKLALATGLIDGIVARVGLAILLGETFGMGIMGFWLGGAFAGYVPFIIGGVYFWSGLWRRVKPVVARRSEE